MKRKKKPSMEPVKTFFKFRARAEPLKEKKGHCDELIHRPLNNS